MVSHSKIAYSLTYPPLVPLTYAPRLRISTGAITAPLTPVSRQCNLWPRPTTMYTYTGSRVWRATYGDQRSAGTCWLAVGGVLVACRESNIATSFSSSSENIDRSVGVQNALRSDWNKLDWIQKKNLKTVNNDCTYIFRVDPCSKKRKEREGNTCYRRADTLPCIVLSLSPASRCHDISHAPVVQNKWE